MNNNDLTQESSVIQNEITAAKTLLSTLEDEFAALNNRATPAEIYHITERKGQGLLLMEQASQQRASLISSSDPLLTAEPLKSSWQQLRELAQACQHQNQVNGCIINSAKRHVEQAAAILHGRQPTSELGYASSGKTVTEKTPRAIARA